MRFKKDILIIISFLVVVVGFTGFKVFGNTLSTTKLTLPTGFCTTEERAVEVALYEGISLPIKSVKVVSKNAETKDITANLKTAEETKIYKSDTNLFKYKDMSKYKVLTCSFSSDQYKTPIHKLEANENTGLSNITMKLTNNGYLGYYNVFDATLEIEFYDNEIKDVTSLSANIKGHVKDQAFVVNVLDGKLNSYVIPSDVRSFQPKEFYNYLTLTYYSSRQKLLEENIYKSTEFQQIASKINFNDNDTIYDKSKVIMDYIRSNVKFDYGLIYSNTRSKEYQSILTTIANKKTNCQGFAFTYFALAKYFGLECNYVSGKATQEENTGHRWNVVHDTESNKYIFIDCTSGYIGYGDDKFYSGHLVYNATTDKFEACNPYGMPLYIPETLITK